MDTLNFDLLAAQQEVREIKSPKKLFETWERLSYAFLRREISQYMLDEMKTIVWEQFETIRTNSLPKSA